MAKNKLKKIVDKKVEKIFRESDVLVMLERMDDNFKIMAEGYAILDRKIDRKQRRRLAVNASFSLK